MNMTTLRVWRIAVGLLQGLGLYLIEHAVSHKAFGLSQGYIVVPLYLLFVFVPWLIILGIGRLKPKLLGLWIAGVSVLLIILGAHDFLRRSIEEFGIKPANDYTYFLNIHPSYTFIFVAGLVLGQSLITSGATEQCRVASYPCYFDTAWKLAVQFTFSSALVVMFWLVMWMGIGLFSLINLKFLADLVREQWFSIPMTSVAFAYALHLTDVRDNIVRGIRTLKLILLSWLLPVMTLFAAIFVVSLPFQGLQLMWSTHHTSQIMLGAAVWMILLINTAYHDGTDEHRPPKIIQYSAWLSSILLTPMTLIALYALDLRVNEHGWTVNMIGVCACMIVTLVYALGYLWSALTPRPWLKNIERTNIFNAYFIVFVVLILATPIADPARLSVADQIQRLDDGRTPVDKFDYAYLKKHGEVYGIEALNKLKQDAVGDNAETIKKAVDRALKGDTASLPPPPTPADLANNIAIYPVGKVLPESFVTKNWASLERNSLPYPTCLTNKEAKCEVFLMENTGDTPQYLVLSYVNSGMAYLFKFQDNDWIMSGNLTMISCKNVRDGLRQGHFKDVPALMPDLEVNGIRMQIHSNDRCPEAIK